MDVMARPTRGGGRAGGAADGAGAPEAGPCSGARLSPSTSGGGCVTAELRGFVHVVEQALYGPGEVGAVEWLDEVGVGPRTPGPVLHPLFAPGGRPSGRPRRSGVPPASSAAGPPGARRRAPSSRRRRAS